MQQQQGVILTRRPYYPASRVLQALWPVWRFARRQPVGFVSAIIILALVIMAVIGPSVAPYESGELTGDRLQAPSLDHPLGTDQVSRDILSRVISGARISLQVGIAAVALGIGGGAVIGVVSGYLGGRVDTLVQRLMDAMLSFPSLVLALSLAAVMEPGLTTVILAIGVTILPSANRVVRGSTLSIKENVYIEAARSIGASDLRIMVFHIVPNLFAVIMVMISITMGAAIIIEASLSFLGLGVQPPSVSWGEMINSSRIFMEVAPWMVLAPGVAIALVVLSFNLLGDALRDYFDPNLRGR